MTAENVHEFPLSRYAAEFWIKHYRQITDDVDKRLANDFIYDLVKSKKHFFLNWLKLFNPRKPWAAPDFQKKDEAQSPLYYMSCVGVQDVVQILLDSGANVNESCPSALLAASEQGHEAVVQLLMNNGVDFNAETGLWSDALSAASFAGHENMVRILLNYGVNVRDEIYGNALSTALYDAAFGGYGNIVQVLLNNGANVNAKSERLGNALGAASLRGHKKIVRLLLNNGADAKSALKWLLSDKEASLGEVDGSYDPSDREGMVKLLLKKGLEPGVMDSMKRTIGVR